MDIFQNKLVVQSLTYLAMAASVGQMLIGNDERAVLFCFWASLILALRSIQKAKYD